MSGRNRLTVAALSQKRPTPVHLEPDAETRAGLAHLLGAEAIRKLRLTGEIAAEGKDAWRLDAVLGATVVQPCIVTLEPVTTRIDMPVVRRFVPPHMLAEPEPGSETQMPEDDTLEPLGADIDLDALLAEVLALALPAYPRREDAALGEAVSAPDGVTPLRDEDTRPFAGLAGLRDKLQDRDD